MVVLPTEGDVYLFQRLSGLAARRSICDMMTSRGDRHRSPLSFLEFQLFGEAISLSPLPSALSAFDHLKKTIAACADIPIGV
jgi:hypothetical protein